MAESASDPTLYWIEPEERGILPLDRVTVPKRLARTIRQEKFQIKVDSDFHGVIAGCAASRAGRRTTWINMRIAELYAELFDMGHCHTIEAWLNGTPCRRALRRPSRRRVFRRIDVFNRARRQQGDADLSRRKADRGRLRAARHAIRHPPSEAIRRTRNFTTGISQTAQRGAANSLRLPRIARRRRRPPRSCNLSARRRKPDARPHEALGSRQTSSR